MKARSVLVVGMSLILAVIVLVALVQGISSSVKSQIENSVLKPCEVVLDELPKGTKKVTYLGRGWFIFELSVNGTTRKFLGMKYVTSHYYSNIQFTELRD